MRKNINTEDKEREPNETIIMYIQNGIDVEKNQEILLKNNIMLCEKIVSNELCGKVLYGMDREDLLQEAVIKLLDLANTYDAGKNALFSTYAWTLIKYHIRDLIEKNRKIAMRELQVMEDDTEDIFADTVQIDICEQIIEEEESKKIRKEVLKLKDKRERYVILEIFYNGRTQCQIAKMMNLTENQISRIKKNALWNIYGECVLND